MKKRLNIGAAVSFTGTAVNLLLFLVKFYVANSSNSISIYLDSLNNLMDSFVCVAAGLGFILAEKKASEKYPFGLGRTEGVVNFIISIIILVTGLSFGYASLERLMYPVPIWYSVKYAAVILSTVAVKLLLLVFYRRANKRLGSKVLGSLGLDSALDFFVTLCTLSSFSLSNSVSFSVDGVAGFIISAVLVFQGVKLIIESFGFLLGKRDGKLCSEAERIILENSHIVSVEDVQCHSYGKLTVVNARVTTADGTFSPELTAEIEESLNKFFKARLYLS